MLINHLASLSHIYNNNIIIIIEMFIDSMIAIEVYVRQVDTIKQTNK